MIRLVVLLLHSHVLALILFFLLSNPFLALIYPYLSLRMHVSCSANVLREPIYYDTLQSTNVISGNNTHNSGLP